MDIENFDRRKIVVNLGFTMVLIYWSVRSFIRRVGDEVKGVDDGYRYISQLEETFYQCII